MAEHTLIANKQSFKKIIQKFSGKNCKDTSLAKLISSDVIHINR